MTERKTRKSGGGRRRAVRPRLEELERRIALTAPGNKKNPVPPPYAPGTAYGLVRRSNLGRA